MPYFDFKISKETLDVEISNEITRDEAQDIVMGSMDKAGFVGFNLPTLREKVVKYYEDEKVVKGIVLATREGEEIDLLINLD